MARPFTPEQSAYVKGDDFSVEGYFERFPYDKDRSVESLFRHRRRNPPATGRVVLHQKKDDPAVLWDKHVSDVHWTDYIEPLEALGEIRRRASASQDFANIRIASNEGVPIAFISDWHMGSWGTSMRRVARMTKKIRDLGLRVAVLGDMLQMAIRLRGILEISDNALPTRDQIYVLGSWLEDMEPNIVWSTFDNHSVEREEDATGFSRYAELFKEKTIYHSGIGHVDLTIAGDEGEQTYKIASSHKFKGNTSTNPLGGQMKYMRTHGIDRELAVAGDSHTPAYYAYPEGPITRVAINCGTLQTDSGYGKRHFSPFAHDWMPVVVFYPDEHMMTVYQSIEHYERSLR